MSARLVDEAIACCDDILMALPETPLRGELRLRLDVLRHEARSRLCAAQRPIDGLEKLALDLLGDVLAARPTAPARNEHRRWRKITLGLCLCLVAFATLGFARSSSRTENHEAIWRAYFLAM